jgi:endonuclease/exonuclease/phosphatase family metal-dependent hydrolase
MEYQLDSGTRKLEHQLALIVPEIRKFKTRRQFEASAFYKEQAVAIDQVINGVEWHNTHNATPRCQLRVVAWNIERGKELAGVLNLLEHHPNAVDADILILTETDIGMARSGNRNVPLEIAQALGLNYFFANSYLALTSGDVGEQGYTEENTLALHGAAILSRYPIQNAYVTTIPLFKDAFHTEEKRLGQRKGITCSVRIANYTYAFTAVHLDFNTSPRRRARQLDAILQNAQKIPAEAHLVGGDMNSSTYNLHHPAGLLANLFYKQIILGFDETVAHYMTPQLLFEKPLFDCFRRYGLEYDRYNDCTQGTFFYDMNDPTTDAKSHQFVPDFMLQWLRRRLKAWNGCVPFRLDWFAGRGFKQVQCQDGAYGPPRVIDRPQWEGRPISDHSPIIVDIELPAVS